MGIFSFLSGNSSVVDAVADIATEWIQTDMESAEARTVMIKALDKNGKMRRDLSNRVTSLYTLYILVALFLLVCESFGLADLKSIAIATEKVTELFFPITTLFGVIVSASFGVNYANTKQNK